LARLIFLEKFISKVCFTYIGLVLSINKLKEFREKKEWTQEKIADKSGVTRQTIISIEKGKYVPSLELALKFAEVFNCKVEDLFKI
jgi:putative transcriptional regulator